MAATFPYTHYSCPCSDLASSTPIITPARRTSTAPSNNTTDEDTTFNSHDPRAEYALYPLDHLLFCDECDAIRCPICYGEEIINWYCPQCLFEVPSSTVKADGNRCARNCCNCPVCTALLAVAVMPQEKNGSERLKPSDAAGEEAYLLQCQYCDWSSLDIGVQFSKSTKITEQLAKQRKSRITSRTDSGGDVTKKTYTQRYGREDAFDKLLTFYKAQLSEAGDPQAAYGSSPYGSPANLARIMSIYGGLSVNALKKSREKPQPMREAGGESEGAVTYGQDDKLAEDALLQQIEGLSWEDTTAPEQRLSSAHNNNARHLDDLWPAATPLRTRKGRRCRTCRQFLSRPDPKVNNLRYKIRLLAQNHVPRLSIKPLHAPSPLLSHPSFRLRPTDVAEQPTLRPHTAYQYILTVRNPIFETVNITLATPTTTPGRVASRVTILCPTFTVGPAGDVWDEALSTSTTSSSFSTTRNDGGRQAAMASLTGRNNAGISVADEAGDRQPEAGKVWERSRSSTSVVVEVVAGSLTAGSSIVPKTEAEMERERLEEGDEVLEVPVFVRAEWEVVEEKEGGGEVLGVEKRAGRSVVSGGGGGGGEKVKKDVGFWCVLGLGRIVEGGV
ncbi:hypothetical protein LTR78_009871 [Recurvomyces mirabilis]|uniref:Dynactin subunit 4 n=1 Tax=Recurvomyces mirabilis TaxID=574656 RepID=A0AAE0TT23_9PEZI|nr:hypothetical protein LTR78_009871 [Recurvomyces mirabilis]KAK5150546.1 hypothetical protein LTS14_010040 [Recurvomyces mirabilis]